MLMQVKNTFKNNALVSMLTHIYAYDITLGCIYAVLLSDDFISVVK